MPDYNTAQKISESIRPDADGFCFVTDGSSQRLSTAEFTSVPSTCFNEADAPLILHALYPGLEADANTLIERDTFTGLSIISPAKDGFEKSLAAVLLDILARDESASLAVYKSNGNIGFVAAGAGIKPYLNCTPDGESFTALYLAIRVWKGLPHSNGSRIFLLGFGGDSDATTIHNLKFMTGDNTVCEL